MHQLAIESAIKKAAQRACATMPGRYEANVVKNADKPHRVHFGVRRVTGSLLIHNITPAMVILCGDNLHQVFHSCLREWATANGPDSVRFVDRVCKPYFSNNAKCLPEAMHNEALLTDMVEAGLQVILNPSVEDVHCTAAALSKFGTVAGELFDDNEFVTKLVDGSLESENGGDFTSREDIINVFRKTRLLKTASGDSRVALTRLSPFMKGSRPADELSEVIYIPEGLDPQIALRVLQLTRTLGSPQVLLAYHNKLKAALAELDELASASKISELADIGK